MDHCSPPLLRTRIILTSKKKSPGMNLLVCLATLEQVITSTSPVGSFQLLMSVSKKRHNKKNAKMKVSNDFMPKKKKKEKLSQ